MIWLRKSYFHNLVEKMGGTFSRPLFRNKNSLKIRHFKRFTFFLSLNMAIWQASRPTVIDSGVWEKHFWIERSNFLVSKGIEDLVEASDASWLLTLHSFVCPAHESLESFHFRSRLPFWVFTLESHFFFHSFSFFC